VRIFKKVNGCLLLQVRRTLKKDLLSSLILLTPASLGLSSSLTVFMQMVGLRSLEF